MRPAAPSAMSAGGCGQVTILRRCCHDDTAPILELVCQCRWLPQAPLPVLGHRTTSAVNRLPAMSPAPDRYLKIRDVAQRISVCTKSVRNYIANGDFGPVMRLSQTDIRIPESGLQKFIRERLV